MRLQIPRSILTVLNQLYEVEQKLKKQDDSAGLGRNIGKMKDALAEEGLPTLDARGGQLRIGLAYEDPMGQPFKETRTDLDATIAGPGTDNLVVVEVIKPIIRAIGRTARTSLPRSSKKVSSLSNRERSNNIVSKMINFAIDLGTTNSLVAKFNKGTVEVFKNPNGFKETLPSVVGFRNDRILVGEPSANLP